MAKKRRPMEVFSMSFLDCMSCGFGAVILFFMIINSQVIRDVQDTPEDLIGETERLEYEILEYRKNLVLAKNSMEELEDEKATAEEQIAAIVSLIASLKEELEKLDTDSLAKIERIEKLQSDIKSLEEQRDRLLALEQQSLEEGAKVRRFTGDGDRQYLTGLKVGGSHIMVLVDASASMLHKDIADIIIRRNMDDDVKLRSLKWRQAVASVDWLTAQFPQESKFQIYTFNNTSQPVLKGSDGIWLEVGEGEQLEEAVRLLRRTVPAEGTNLLGAFAEVNKMNPQPDNLILLIDSLPTMDAPTAEHGFVTGQQRLRMFYDAERSLPGGMPVNILLYPMEGDTNASLAYWLMAYHSGGSFMSISKDWP